MAYQSSASASQELETLKQAIVERKAILKDVGAQGR